MGLAVPLVGQKLVIQINTVTLSDRNDTLPFTLQSAPVLLGNCKNMTKVMHFTLLLLGDNTLSWLSHTCVIPAALRAEPVPARRAHP